MRLIIMGPPGAGKGTQSTRIAERYGVPAVATGDIFRANVREGTPLGVQAQGFMDAGDYVPDSVTNEMVRDRLGRDDCVDGFLLDGYPRTLAQVDELDATLTAIDAALDAVLVLTVDPEELVHRLVRRAESDARSDDTEAVVRHRQGVYAEQTAPLIEVYAERGLLVEVDGMGEVDEVTARVHAALDGVRA